jgi:dihydrofolate reductase
MVVLTRDTAFRAEGAIVVHDFDQALAGVSGDDEVFVIGGGDIFRLAMPRVSRMYVTAVHAEVEGDTFFPNVDWTRWALIGDVRFPADEKNDHDYSFRVYDRLRLPNGMT